MSTGTAMMVVDGDAEDLDEDSVESSAPGPVQRLPIACLRSADSPRLAGEDSLHAQTLAETDAPLPPILVHRETMRVIDGMHRLRAAVLRGETEIDARLFEGSADAAFVLAVQANVTHGLPLSLADREAAAQRIVRSHPHWSDRAIATAAGLAAKTVAAIRRQDADTPDVHARLGRDGRLRPVNSAEGRRIASELISRKPDASLREIAKTAGISPATARDVRERMKRGDDPLPLRQRGGEPRPLRPGAGRRTPMRDRSVNLQNLRRDPSLRFTESGRALLRWLDGHATGPEGCAELIGAIPAHCTYVVADIARSVAEEWLEFAEQLKQRANEAA